MKLQICYKVLRLDNEGKLISAIIDDNRFQMTYPVGELIKPRAVGTKIMVFKSLIDAVEFAAHNHRMAIYECIAVNPQPLPYVMWLDIRNSLYRGYNNITRGWKNLFHTGDINELNKKLTETNSGYARMAPSGSLACSQIQLVREVTKDERNNAGERHKLAA